MANREAVVKTGDMVEGRYRIIKTLGAGGMGTVYLAEHALIKRRVAMKILHPELATDSNVVERFMNEARAAGTLGHPNIVESTDMGFTHDHVPYIVFEFLEGTLLTDEIYRVGGLPVRRAVRIADQIASALAAAHSASIIHRDLKSDNIFLTDKDDALDHVKVLDFGISRFLEVEERQRGMQIGTPEFMAPEQITDPDSVDARTDIYALGVIIYEMLTARRPFSNDEDPRQLMHRIVHEEPPPLMRPEVPHALGTILMERMLAKDPADRFESMADTQIALEQFSTRGDGTPVPRRRSAPMVAVQSSGAENLRLPRAASRETPSVDGLDGATPIAMGQVSLPKHPAIKRPYALYGLAGGGILIGTIGLIVGLRGGDDRRPASQPIAQPLPAAATSSSAPAPAAPERIDVKLDADVAKARVVFRRRVAEAPVALEINATDVVELVEISAPGYKTTRYWLTFDRPTMLTAHLVRGKGSIEATEEETLVALGEVTQTNPSTPASAEPVPAKPIVKAVAVVPAAPKPSITTPTPSPTPAPTAVALAPRKIGRTAEAEQAAAEAAPGAEPVTPATTDETVKSPSAEPTEAKLETKPEIKPEASAEVAKVVDAPKHEAAVVAIDKTTLASVITTHQAEVQKCLAEGKKKNPQMAGTLNLQLQVDAAGKVFRAQAQSTLKNPLVSACIVKAANAWRFPSRSGTEVVSVAYPFTIK